MKYSDAVKSILLAAIDELAAQPEKYAVNPGKDFTRNRKLSFKTFLLMFLSMEGDCIKEELYRYFGRTTDTPSKAAFYRQRQKLRDDALRNLIFAFNSKLKKRLYNGRYQLVACDGSAADIYRDPGDADTFYEPNGKSTLGFNQIHVNFFFSILDRRFTDVIVQPGRKRNEYSAFCQAVDAAGGGDVPTIYFADMGYASYNNFAHVIENGQHFLIRANDARTAKMLGRHDMDGVKELDCHADLILSRSQSKKKRLHPEKAESYRYICRDVAMDYLPDPADGYAEYPISLRIVRFEIEEGKFENIITNLPDLEFDIGDFKELYHLRWSEENAFRDLKYPLCLKAFHSKKYKYIVQEVWARAILHNFCFEITMHVEIDKRDTKYEYQANFSEACKICRDFLRLHDGETAFDVEGLIASNIEAVRPGRSFPRRKRFQLPVSFCYRN